LNAKHLLKYGICVIEEFGMQAHLSIETLSNISDVSFFITNDVLSVVPLIFIFGRLHVFEANRSFYKAHKNYLLIDLREGFNLKGHFSEISIACASK
jgi:hypothetical protein